MIDYDTSCHQVIIFFPEGRSNEMCYAIAYKFITLLLLIWNETLFRDTKQKSVWGSHVPKCNQPEIRLLVGLVKTDDGDAANSKNSTWHEVEGGRKESCVRVKWSMQ